ncbi:MAG: DNA-binding protein WhiA [Coriobacteriales bacterium]|nr:DNA-binding protein WhiA [Coriobacteriales bacterium]
MSFTAEVKDELSRVEGQSVSCALAELSALVRICGTLSFRGRGAYALRISTETGSVARTTLGLLHQYLDLETTLTVRRSTQRKTRNYLIEVPTQEQLGDDLVRLGIILPHGGLEAGVPAFVRESVEDTYAYVRGAFMAAGFVADPRGDFHLEIAVSGGEFAQALAELLGGIGISARINHRRSSYVVYLKSFEDVRTLLRIMGATRSAQAVEGVHQIKSVKNEVNRRVNAELANDRRSSRSGADQLLLIQQVEERVGIDKLSPALRQFCELRRSYPEMSLADLGALCDPPSSKSAMYHRVLRLQELAGN